MKKKELMAIIDGYHDEDEILIVSPGNRLLEPTELDTITTNKIGKIVIASNWIK